MSPSGKNLSDALLSKPSAKPYPVVTSVPYPTSLWRWSIPTNQSWQKQRKNIRSTSSSTPPTESNNHEFTNNNEIACLLINIEDLARTQTQHADLTGRLPQSLRGIQYLLISEYRVYIHLEPQASRTSSDYIKSHAATTVFFRRHCCWNPSVQTICLTTICMTSNKINQSMQNN